jgi:hypothetical protein
MTEMRGRNAAIQKDGVLRRRLAVHHRAKAITILPGRPVLAPGMEKE